ncbi:MAG: LytTR family transcriptional regulator [Bacteroidales bacterium]|jgi:DNA-binding LytR/AlgR family response regulator|nr:LytTR family transcriptional regulator [Bacteroidales bacterium]
MKRITFILLAVLLISSGITSLSGCIIATYLLLGAFSGGIVSEFIMPHIAKRFVKAKYEPLPTVNEQDKNEICERITIKTGQKIDIIDVKNIVFFAANGDYVSIYTEKGVWLKEMTMKDLEKILPSENFVRVHRSFIVNVNCIKAIDKYKKGQYIISLSNKETIKMSDTGYAILKNKLSL